VTNLLSFRSVTKKYRGLTALSELSFDIDAASITSIVGPNGAGKSTIFNVISGYTEPTSGGIIFDGQTITGLAPYKICQIGIARAFQIAKPFPGLSVQENILVAASFGKAGPRDPERVTDESLALCRLTEERHNLASSLTVGGLRRLELARAFAARPRLLLADEPCAGLNETETTMVTNVLADARGRGLTILLVEHDIRAVRKISDRVIVIEAGRKIADGTEGEVFAQQSVIDAYLGAAL
jgi:branched-chain amino acid transport system ATP-binding protein